MRIGQMAEATGVSARSLRYYEQSGLIASRRTSGGWRDFDAAMVDRVVLIQNLFAAGLCSSTISELLPCLVAPADERTSELGKRLAEEIERLEASRRNIDREIDVLRSLRSELAPRKLERGPDVTHEGTRGLSGARATSPRSGS